MNRTTTALGLMAVLMVGGWAAAGIAWADRGKKNAPKLKLTDAGVIPTELGPVVAAFGDASSTVLVLSAPDNTLTVIRMRGSTVPDTALQIRRQYEADKSEPLALTDLGTLPASLGDLVGASGDATSAFLVFGKPDSDLTLIRVQGSELPTKAQVIRRKD